MLIHLRGANFVNKGAELMLYSALHHIQMHFPSSSVAVSQRIGTYEKRRSLDLKDLVYIDGHRFPGVCFIYNSLAKAYSTRKSTLNPGASYQQFSQDTTRSGNLLRRAITRFRELNVAQNSHAVVGADVDIVLDLSGFAYGDPWGAKKCWRAVEYYRRVRRNGGRIILMPQQLGPFSDVKVAHAFRALSSQCDLIFARDKESYEAAASIIPHNNILKQAPDFTVTQRGIIPEGKDRSHAACIIPNFKMIEETTPEVRAAYPRLLHRCVVKLRERGIACFVLLHEFSGRDLEIAEVLRKKVGDIEVIAEENPLRIKGIIGSSFLAVGSRFHGLVNSLSQSVPSIGTSWSHKYQMLFVEYGCAELIISPLISELELEDIINRLLDDECRALLSQTLHKNYLAQLEKAAQMWDQVDNIIAHLSSGRG